MMLMAYVVHIRACLEQKSKQDGEYASPDRARKPAQRLHRTAAEGFECQFWQFSP